VTIQRLRVPLGFVAAFAALYLATPSWPTILAGLPLALAGLAFRMLAAGTIRKNAALATGGPYAWTRNPLYFGSALLAAGFAVMSGSLAVALLLGVPFAFVYSRVIAREEAILATLFPEAFAAFRASTPAFIPRFRAAPLDFSFAQYRANREYNAALGLACALAILIVKGTWR
jgi:protein-S-isoprenylcysteine O-methyltransferase Ste14